MSICRLIDASRALADINPDLARWLATAAERLRRGLPASIALELSGGPARRERDRYLVQAATALRQEGETKWALAGRLSARINAAPRRDLVAELLALASQAAPLPTSQRRLYDALLAHLPD